MPFIAPELIVQAKQMDLLTYLKNYEPYELVKYSGNTYCTRTHDSLKISNGKWIWWSRGIGGRSALDYLIKVKGYSFLEAVETIIGHTAIQAPVYEKPQLKEENKPLLLPEKCASNRVITKTTNIMAKVYEFLANGFEEVEGLAPVDILRRGGVDIKTVSVTGSEYVETSHGITIKADLMIENADLSDADMLLLPGGLPGATNLRDHEGVCAALKAQAAKGGRIGAICAAPLVLGHLGLLEGRYATCYPGFEKFMTGAHYTHELFTIDGNIITGEGPAATLPYSYEILRMFKGDDTVASLKEGMMYNHLMAEGK